MILRKRALQEVSELLQQFPAVGILGARQVGKTTLVKEIQKKSVTPCKYFDLEKPSDNVLLNNAEEVFREFSDHLIILDEIQLKPELFSVLRPMIDEQRTPGRFLLLGSASPDIVRKSSESLAGRISYLELTPFSLREVDDLSKHWLAGGFPDSYLATSQKTRSRWLRSFIKSYSNAELPLLGLRMDPIEISNLWVMLAHQSGQLLNYSNLAKSFGVSSVTIKSYLNFFRAAFLIDILQPFSHNAKKRIVKSPKLYLNDTGILHGLLKIENHKDLTLSPHRGISWETYVVQEIKKEAKEHLQLFFYRTSNGAEVDLVITKSLIPVCCVEIKYSYSSQPRRGFYESIKDLSTSRNFVITQIENEMPGKGDVRITNLITFLSKHLPNL